MSDRSRIRNFQPGDEQAAYHVCMKTGNFGDDGEPFFGSDPDALGRIYVGPYLRFEPQLALILEDEHGVAGYTLAARDSRSFYQWYDREWRPRLCEEFSDPSGPPECWSRVQQVHHLYHHPDFFCPEPYADYPSHLHIDLLPRAQGQGYGRRMIEAMLVRLASQGSPGLHLGMSAINDRAHTFYRKLGFAELCRQGVGEAGSIYMGMRLND